MASTYLTRTQTAGNRKIWTFSAWVKRSSTAGTKLISAGSGSGNCTFIGFDTNKLAIESLTSSLTKTQLITERRFRDPAAWYHIVVGYDSTPATPSTSSIYVYINGVKQTSFSHETYPSQNEDSHFNTTVDVRVGSDAYAASGIFDGVMAHVHFIDGTLYTASDFGETDSTSGIWVAKTGPSVTYGTNG
jgi:hypothetical protein